MLVVAPRDAHNEFMGQFRLFRGRILRLYLERMVCLGVIAAGLLSIVLLIVDLLTVWYLTPALLIGILCLGALTGGLLALLRKPGDMDIALTIERHHALQDRVSTVIALQQDVTCDPEYYQLIAADTTASLQQLTPSQVLVRRITRLHHIMFATWVVLLALVFLPTLPWLYSHEDQV